MSLALRTLILGTLLLRAGMLAADDTPPKIKDGISGKIKSVDVQAKTFTITTAAGKERTFTISNETILLGPLGGRLPRQLRDSRFRQGFPVTVLADGNAATKVVLGFAQYAGKDKAAAGGATNLEQGGAKAITEPAKTATASAQAKEGMREFSGKIKIVDVERELLVVTLSNGKNRPFLLAKGLIVLVDGKASKLGIKEPALKIGAQIKVTVEDDSQEVREIRIGTASSGRSKNGE